MKGANPLLKRVPLGAFWSWIIRLVVLAAIVAALAPLAARSGPVRRMVAARVVGAAEAATGRTVTLDDASVGLLPVSIRLAGLRIAGHEGSMEEPMVDLREASAQLSLRALLRGQILVEAVEVDGIDVRWEAGEEQEARRPGGEAGEAGRRIALRRLNVRNGTVAYRGRKGRFSINAEGLEATAASFPCEATLCADGNARAGGFLLLYDDHRLEGSALSVRFGLDGRRLEISRFHVTGAAFDARGRARWQAGAGGEGSLTTSLEASGEAVDNLARGYPVSADAISTTVTLEIQDGEASLTGTSSIRNATLFGDIRVRKAEGDIGWNDGSFTAKIRASGVIPDLEAIRPAGGADVDATLSVTPGAASYVDLDVGPLPYRDILARIDPRMPRSDVAASARGRLSWETETPSTLAGTLDLRLKALEPRAPRPGARPVLRLEGAGKVDVRRDGFSVREGRLAAPGLAGVVSGNVRTEAETADFTAQIGRADLPRVLEALRDFPAAGDLSGGLEGSAAGRIRLALRPRGTRIDGRLVSSDLEVIRKDARTEPVRAVVGFEAEGDRVGIPVLELSGTGWTSTGSLELDLSQAWILRHSDLHLNGVPGEMLWSLAGLTTIQGGRISGSARMDLGAPNAGRAPARSFLRMDGGAVAGIPLVSLEVEAEQRGSRLILDRVEARGAAGTLDASGELSPGPGEGRLEISASGLSLAELARIFAPEATDTGGSLNLSGLLEFSAEEARLTGSARGINVTLEGFPVGMVSVPSLQWSSGEAGELALRLQAHELGAAGSLRRSGGEESPLEVDLSAQGLDLSRLRELFPEGTAAGLGGRADLSLQGTVPVAAPVDAELQSDITHLDLEAGGLTFRLAEPTRLRLAGRRLTLDRARVTGEGTDLTLSGSVNVETRTSGGGQLSGRFDAGLLAVMLPNLTARGAVQVELSARATADGIVYSGEMTGSGIGLDHPASPSPVEGLQLAARVASDGSLTVDSLDFRFAGGTVTGEGTGKLEGLQLSRAEIRLHGKGMTTEPIPNLAVLFDGETVIASSGTSATLSGRLDIIRAVYREEFGLGPGRLGRGRVAPSEKAAGAGPRLDLNIDIVAPSDILVRNSSARLEGSANLKVSGSLSRPELTGRLSLFEGGTFRFRDVTYRSAGGGILFDDPDTFDPLLDFSAITDVKDYAITLHVHGRYSNPRFDLTSEPSLSQTDIVSLLMTGETAGSGFGPGSAGGFVAEENVAQYLTAPLSESLGSTVGKVLGLTTIQLQPQFVNGSADPTARLTLTKRVSPQLLFTYSDNLGTSQDEIYQFEYELSRAWQFIGLRDRDGSVSGDLRFRMHWGGPDRPGAAGGERSRPEISRLEFSGSPVGDERTLRKRSGVKPGKPYSRGDALEGRESLREYLIREGYPLADITVETRERTREDGETVMDLSYSISPGTEVALQVDGLKRNRGTRKAVREAWERGIYLEDLAATGKDAIQERLGADGYASARVSAEVVEKERKVVIRYTVDRGPKVQVRSLKFAGAGPVPEETLRRAMATGEDTWRSRGILRPPELQEDLDALQSVYLSMGYLDVRIGTPSIEFSEDRSLADVVIPIETGPVWNIGRVEIEGVTDYPVESVLQATLLHKGDLLRPSAVSSAEERVRDLLDGNGFYQVRVGSRIEGPPEEALVAITVEEGPRRTVARVDIQGNDRTGGRVLEREIDLEPGDPVSRNAMLRIQRKLYTLGIFRAVDVKAEPLPDNPEKARVVVKVIEGDPILTGFGIGYDTEEQLQGLIQLGHNNIFGTGRSVSLLLRGSSINRRAQASLTDRRLFGIPFEGTLTTSYEERERESFDERRTGVGLQFLRRFTPRLTGLGRYNLSAVDLLDVRAESIGSLDDAEQQIFNEAVTLGQVGASLAYDTRDDILAPTRGLFTTGDFSVFARPFGSEATFTKSFFSISGFRSTRKGIVFGAAARVGHEHPFGQTTAVPLAARFFSGGDNTLRGFKVDEAGPLDYTSEEPVGGELQVLFNAEMRFPIWGALKGVLFYDLGNTFLSTSRIRLSGTEVITKEVTDPADCAFDLTPYPGEETCPVAIQDGLRHTLGAGLRINTPLGPIRFEVGRKMDRRFGSERFDLGGGFEVRKAREESLYEFFLSIGQAF